MNRATLMILLGITATVSLSAQVQQRQATMKGDGSGDRGKCTIEVRVDGTADVEILGDRGVIRTLAGRPASWVRFECEGRMPPNPSDFEFSGIDGRGRQELLRDPRSNRGIAVVRIDDPSGGDEGYTFDLEWRGGTSSASDSTVFGGRNDSTVFGGRNDSYGTQDSVGVCEQAVRDRAYEQYGTRDIQIRYADTANSRGRREVVTGTLELRRGTRGQWEAYDFSCTVNVNNGRVRAVQITPLNANTSGSNTGSYFPGVGSTGNTGVASGSAVDDCRTAVQRRLRTDGYRNVEWESLRSAGRQGRNDRLRGAARAQRDGATYNFNVACSVDLNTGELQSVNVNRR